MTSRQPYIAPYCHEAVDILYADDDLLLVNKPSGLLSVPGRHPDNKDCLISRVQSDYPSARIVHRLDMDTSGIMVLALNASSHRDLSQQFEQRKTKKTYEAIVQGLIPEEQGEIDLPICCDWPNRPKQKVDFENGKKALTCFETISHDEKEQTSRLTLKPVTGRSHQLRIHLASIGHPILGCSFYGNEASAERLLLHACDLTIQHPVTGETVHGNSPTPF